MVDAVVTVGELRVAVVAVVADVADVVLGVAGVGEEVVGAETLEEGVTTTGPPAGSGPEPLQAATSRGTTPAADQPQRRRRTVAGGIPHCAAPGRPAPRPSERRARPG